jgi:hypothetical protein
MTQLLFAFNLRKILSTISLEILSTAGIVLTMIGLSNSNKTRYQVGSQSRTNACI